MKGKTLSLTAKIIAGVFVIVMILLKSLGFVDIPVTDVISVGAFFALLFSPIDISIWLDKFSGVKKTPTSL
jgi:hypothetical protein